MICRLSRTKKGEKNKVVLTGLSTDMQYWEVIKDVVGKFLKQYHQIKVAMKSGVKSRQKHVCRKYSSKTKNYAIQW